MKPSVGRIVHYTNLGDADGRYPPEQQAAVITKVVKRSEDALGEIERALDEADPKYLDDDERGYDVSLHIFYTTGSFDMQKVPFSAEYARGHWTWPPRV